MAHIATIIGCRVEFAGPAGLTVELELDAEHGRSAVGRAVLEPVAGLADDIRRAAAQLEGRTAYARHPACGQLGPISLDPRRRVAVGALEFARLDGVSRLHGLPLHDWLGGPVRQSVAVAVELALDAVDGAVTHDLGARGIRHVVLTTAEPDRARLIDLVAAAAERLGAGVEIALQLAGQFEPHALEAILAMGRRLSLAYIADPCADWAAASRACAGALPALALTADRYPLAALARQAVTGGPLVLLADAIALGGPDGVRTLATMAALAGIEVGLLATGKSARSAGLTIQLAAGLPNCARPVVVTAAALAALGLERGMAPLHAAPGIEWLLDRSVARAAAAPGGGSR